METIKQIAKRTGAPGEPQPIKPLSQDLRRAVTGLLQVCPTCEAFMLAMAPDKQFHYLAEPERAHFGGAPSLAALDAAYGKDSAVMWLMAQLFDLGELSGARDKMPPQQAQDIARIIRVSYGYLKTSELMLFFGNIKAGRYGQLFYGTVDALKITQTLRQAFLPARADAITRHESEEQARRAALWQADAITFDEYARRAGYPADTTAVDVLLAARQP